jgi:alkylation response protein AidB-like acyl-CoA dehydrogenase
MEYELSEELKMIRSLAQDFVEQQLMPLERDILGRAADLSDARAWLSGDKETALVKTVRDMGLWGIGVPAEMGGAGLSTLAVCLVEEELARTVIPFHFGDVTPILFDCSPEQREKYLLPAINNEKRPYLALMENESDGDISCKNTRAEKAGGHYVINGKKLSLSRQAADYFGIVFARLGEGITCFLVDKGTPGFDISVKGGAGNGRFSQAGETLTITLKDCRVSAGNRLGEEGRAFSLGGKWLPQRRIVRGARCVGIARRLLEEATARATSAESFGQPVHRRSSVRSALADIAARIHAARLMVHEAACLADSGKPIFQAAAMVKVYTTQIVRAAADSAAHIFNGPSYMNGPAMERLYRNASQASLSDSILKRQKSIIAGDIMKGLKV